jgi:HSP20 family protein
MVTPFGNRSVMRRPDEMEPFANFRREMTRLFEDFAGFPAMPFVPPMRPGQMLGMVMTPRLEVSETDTELRVSAELPGIDAQNVEVTLTDDVLTIRAEKPAQAQEENERDYHVVERSYGTFSRYLRLPFTPDPNKVRAAFKDGVLTITFPKPEEVQQKAHRIEVTQESNSDAGSTPATPQQAQPTQAAAE